MDRYDIILSVYILQVTKDDGIRPTTLEGLLKLKPAFKKGGSTTAGIELTDFKRKVSHVETYLKIILN